MKRHAVTSHVRVTRRGTPVPVREHWKGKSMEFVEAEPPFDAVKIYRMGSSPVLDIVIGDTKSHAFVPFPDGYAARQWGFPVGPKLDPRAIYIVSPPRWKRLPTEKALPKRVANMLAHESMHHVLQSVEGSEASNNIDAVRYGYRARHRGRDVGGI